MSAHDARACNVCGVAPCINPSFCQSCREADRGKTSSNESERVAFLRRMMEPEVSLEQAWNETNRAARERYNGAAPQTAVEALMFSVRRGVDELASPDTQRRLSELDEGQLRAVCGRLQNFKPEIVAAWEPEEIEALMNIWSAVHGH